MTGRGDRELEKDVSERNWDKDNMPCGCSRKHKKSRNKMLKGRETFKCVHVGSSRI